jgi:hypothetical protein
MTPDALTITRTNEHIQTEFWRKFEYMICQEIVHNFGGKVHTYFI